jgi:DNA invertase Pin-like site-specific DNA recombinase
LGLIVGFRATVVQLTNLEGEFESLNIAFVALSDNVDLSTASRRLMFQIIGAMAEFERELIRERVKAGMKNARAKGARIGRPRVSVDATKIARLRDSGASLREIAIRLGVSVGTVAACSKKVSRSPAVVA